MKKKLYAIAIAMSTIISSANAVQACIPLDYQEMKEMPDNVLAGQYCEYRQRTSDNAQAYLNITLFGLGGTNLEKENYTTQMNTCEAHKERVKRHLISRGMAVPSCQ